MRITTNLVYIFCLSNISKVKATQSCRLFQGIRKRYTHIWLFMSKHVGQQKVSIMAGYHVMLAALLFSFSAELYPFLTLLSNLINMWQNSVYIWAHSLPFPILTFCIQYSSRVFSISHPSQWAIKPSGRD